MCRFKTANPRIPKGLARALMMDGPGFFCVGPFLTKNTPRRGSKGGGPAAGLTVRRRLFPPMIVDIACVLPLGPPVSENRKRVVGRWDPIQMTGRGSLFRNGTGGGGASPQRKRDSGGFLVPPPLVAYMGVPCRRWAETASATQR